MNSLCITGASPKALAITHDILHSAGMQTVKNPKDQPDFTLAHWHEQVVSHYNKRNKHQSIKQLGRFWEQIVCNIFMENYHENLWGWANTRSAWLLDFWYSFDPQLKFIFVYIPPANLLADFITHSSDEVIEQDFKNSLHAWQSYYETLLTFHDKYPSQCLWVSIDHYKNKPNHLLEQCKKKWSLSFDIDENKLSQLLEQNVDVNRESAADPISHYFAKEFLQQYSDIKALQQRIEKVTEQAQLNTSLVSLDYAVKHYNNLTKRLVKQEQQHNENSQLRKQSEQYKNKLSELNNKYKKLTVKLENFDKTNHKTKQLEEENELLLLQLHQVQEELEQYFLKSQEHEKQIKQQKEIKAQQDETNQQQQSQLNTINTEHKKTLQRLKQLQIENERLNEVLGNKIKEVEEESELLLLQLHQVQEELEQYVLKYQNSQKIERDLSNRWQKMLSQNINYYDYKSLVLDDAKTEDGKEVLKWQLNEAHIAGRSFSKLHFKTIIDKNIVSLSFDKFSDDHLLHWPVACHSKDECVLHPSQANQLLETLSYSDWVLFKQIYNILTAEIKQNNTIIDSFEKRVEQKILINSLTHSLDLINNRPAVLRFDGLKLKQETVNDDYEHLWFSLSNINFSQQHWKNFEFKLACANLNTNNFIANPRLEFTEASSTVLDSLCGKPNDEMNNKLELRFAAPNEIDINTWNSLSNHDHTCIMALVQCLPNILQRLQHDSVNISRPWQDWQKVIKLIFEIFDTHQALLFTNKKEEALLV